MRWAACAALISAIAAGHAQAAPAPVVAAPLLAGETITVDGLANEGPWDRAQVVDEFVGISPTEGFEPAGSTRVRVLADHTSLYLFFEARFDEPTRVRAYLAERENVNRDDQIAVYLDPFGDGRRAYVFWLNPLGVQQDMLTTLSGFWNPSWDAVFRSHGRIVEGGYDVEIAIPFRSLRFPSDRPSNWRILLKRKYTARDEYAAYPAIKREEGAELLQYAPLLGVEPKRSGVGLELLPTVVVRTGQDRDDESGELQWRPPGFPDTVDPGISAKWQMSPSLALDATFNPDFSQIEADPNQIDNNLRFALSLPERRPFFLEGRELFNGFLLYTRSIVDPIYGVKLSGKQGRVSVAVLHALDEQPGATVVSERGTPGFGEDDVEGAFSFVSHAEVRVDIAQRSSVALAISDKELLRGDALISNAHAIDLSSRVALDDVSQIDASFAYSEVEGEIGGDRLHGPAWFAEYTRNDRYDTVGVGLAGSGEDFRTETVFSNPGIGDVWIWYQHRFEFPGKRVPWLETGASVSRAWDRLDTGKPAPASASQRAWGRIRLPAQTTVRGEARFWDLRFEGRDFEGGWLNVEVTNQALEWLATTVWAAVGDEVRYGEATQGLGRRVGGSAELRAARRLSLQLSTSLSRLGDRQTELSSLWLYRVKGTLGITRALSLRVIAQGRDLRTSHASAARLEVEQALAFSALVRITPSPGTSIHVGFGERWEWGAQERPETQTRDLFLKGSVLIRL